jgi:iron complex transport system substrate-binding protein
MRIVSLLPGATEILFGMGIGEQVVAASHECDYPPAAARLPKATRSLVDSSAASGRIDTQVQALVRSGAALYQIDEQLIASLRPNLIVTQAQCDVCAVRYQDVVDLVNGNPALAGTQVLALNPSSLAEILTDIERLGAATGAENSARSYASALADRIERVKRATAVISTSHRPRAICLEWLDPLMTAGHWTPELIALAGGESGLATAGERSGYIEPAEVESYDPEVLIVAPCGFDLPRTIREAQSLLGQPFWGRVAACRSGKIFAIDGSAYLNRGGPRIIDSLEILAHLLHPDLVPAPLISAGGSAPWQRLSPAQGRLVTG